MKKIVFSALIIMCLFMFAGCKNNKSDALKGTWVAYINYQNIYIEEDEIIGGIYDYYLECDGKGHYDLTDLSGDLANARYKISNNKVTFYDEGNEVLAICKLNDNELDCQEKSYYAFKYTKVS